MTSEELNDRIRTIESKEGFYGGPMSATGKAFPYIGWFWRAVDFDHPFQLGYCDPASINAWDIGKPFVGFMENNKWGYDEWTTTPEQTKHIRTLMIAAVESPGPQTLQAVYDYIQTCTAQEPHPSQP